jgi:hypothetical protein
MIRNRTSRELATASDRALSIVARAAMLAAHRPFASVSVWPLRFVSEHVLLSAASRQRRYAREVIRRQDYTPVR